MPKFYVRHGIRARGISVGTDAAPPPSRDRARKRDRRCAMRSLVVYESWFGNTRRVAEKIAAALAPEGEVELVSADKSAPPLGEVDLLVVGGPTHVHGLSGQRSRDAAVEQGGEPGAGIRDWI